MNSIFLLIATVFNLNVDWSFAKIGSEIYGLDAALAKAAQLQRSDFETVSVPHCVNAHDSYDGHALDAGEKDFFRGWMEYRKTIIVPQGRHFFLEFETVRQSLYVYVNGQLAGFYEAGITPSGYDITPFVKSGETAEIRVITENTAARGTDCFSKEMKEKPGDWGGTPWQWSGTDFNPVQGGLVGNVKLHVKANDSYLTLPLWNTLRTKGAYVWFDGTNVNVEAEIAVGADHRAARPDELQVEVLDAGRPVVAPYHLWSPEDPYLYDVKISLLPLSTSTSTSSLAPLDSVTIRTGFRTTAYEKGKGLLINGVPTWLPGYAQRSTDSWAAIGYAPDWLQDFDAQLIRESGAKFIRWMHVAPKPGPIRAFDKAGIVSAAPAGDKEFEPKITRQWEQRLEAMRGTIIYFRNSPSIIFWEAGNAEISAAHMREMRLLKEELDPHGGRFMGCRSIKTPEQIAECEYVGTMIHRYDTAACDTMKKLGKYVPVMETEYCREESARRLWDVYTPPDFGFNCRMLASGAKQWLYNCYHATQEDFALSNASTADGYGYFYGNRAGGRLLDCYVAAAMLCWSDCNQHGRNSNTENCRSSGRVDAVRIPKENFYAHQVMYADYPKVKILGHWNYPKLGPDIYWYHEKVNDGVEVSWTGALKQRDPLHKTVWVMGSLSVDHVDLFVNGVKKGEAKAPQHLFDFAFPNIDVTESGRVEAVGYDAAGRELCRDTIETAGPAAKLEMKVSTGPRGLQADGSDIAMIDLRLVDAQGRTLPLATNRIDFVLTGDATFMGGWNSGTFGDTSPVGKNWVNLECGLVRVFIRAGRTAGTIRLEAQVDGRDAQGTGETPAPPCVTIVQHPVVLSGGLLVTPPQSYAPNSEREALNSKPAPVAPVRDAEGIAGTIPYRVKVDDVFITFPKRCGAFKPDENTGVVAAYADVLEALKAAGVPLEYTVYPRVPAEKKYLREQGFDKVPMINVTVAGGRELDIVAGLTVIFEDNGRDKNLTNFETTQKLMGELGPLLGYFKEAGVRVSVSEGDRVVKITTPRGKSAAPKVNANIFHIAPPEFQSPSYSFRNGERAFLRFEGLEGKADIRVNGQAPGKDFEVTACMKKAGEMNTFTVKSATFKSVVLETVPTK